MPYEDNLYSMVDESDSDVESVGEQFEPHRHQVIETPGQDEWREEDVLLPVDGYFSGTGSPGGLSNVPQVPNVMVRDPTLDPGTTAESKAREARQEREARDDPHRAPSPQPSTSAHQPTSPTTSRSTARYQPSTATYYSSSRPSSPSYTSYTSRPGTGVNTQRSPLLPTEAPPAYTPSPTSPTTPNASSVDFPRNYSTFQQTMGRPEEQRLLGQPESMGHPPAGPAWKASISQHASLVSWRHFRIVSVVLMLLFVSGAFLGAILAGTSKNRHHPPPPSSPNDPSNPANPPSHGSPPPMDNNPSSGSPIPWFPTPLCGPPPSSTSFTESLSFSPSTPLTFIQNVSRLDAPVRDADQVHVTGSVVLRRIPFSSRVHPSVVLEAAANDASLEVAVSFSRASQTYTVTVPRALPRHGRAPRPPCLAIRATIWVPERAKLEELVVDTVVLGIALGDDLSLSVGKSTSLRSVAGGVSAADGFGHASGFAFSSPQIEANTISGPITGSWPLYDHLSLTTISGPIKIHVSPQPGLNPANLSIKSSSGTTALSSPLSPSSVLLPPRDYRTTIRTTSGTITGSTLFSSSAKIHSTSGTTTLTLLPVLPMSFPFSASLETASTSGTTKIRVLDPGWFDRQGHYLPPDQGPKLRSLETRHGSTSSNLKIEYPASWEGELELSTLSGSLRLEGDGIKVIRGGDGWPTGKRLVARKGEEGGGRSVVKSVSGGVAVGVGRKVW